MMPRNGRSTFPDGAGNERATDVCCRGADRKSMRYRSCRGDDGEGQARVGAIERLDLGLLVEQQH